MIWPSLPFIPASQTYAPWPVWTGSVANLKTPPSEP